MERPRKRTRTVCPGCDQSYSSRYFIEHKKEYYFEGKWLCSSKKGNDDSTDAFDQHLYDYGDDETEENLVCTSANMVLESQGDESSTVKEDVAEHETRFQTSCDVTELPIESRISDGELDDENEQWEEEIEEVRNDTDQKEADHNTQHKNEEHGLLKWMCLFISLWQATSAIPDNAIKLLLEFLSVFLKILGKHCAFVANLASAFPSSMQALWKLLKVDGDQFIKFAVCPKCNSVYTLEEAVITDIGGIKQSLKCSYVKFPNHPQKARRRPCGENIMKQVVLKGGKKSFYPRKVYCYKSVIDSLRQCVSSRDFQVNCEKWRNRKLPEEVLADVTDGKVWKDFHYFLQHFGNYGLMLNFDFFQPFKHGMNSVGVIYLTIMNLPRSERFKLKNVILVGIIPSINRGTSINPFLTPLVKELQELWDFGFQSKSFVTGAMHSFKAALLCVACDLPAARKVCGFLSHSARRGCSKCLKLFEGDFGKRNYSGFDRENWGERNDNLHREACEKLKGCHTQDQLSRLESECGTRLSVLNNLPYFSAVRFCIIDPMHNLYLGTAKKMIEIWIEQGILTEDKLRELQNRVDSAEVASDIGRIPSKIASSFGGFTADQWRSWTNLFSVSALYGILPEKHLECWRIFVQASRLLSSRVIGLSEVLEADKHLLKFCKTIEVLYGGDVITPNMHLHCHLKECIIDYGPVFSFWCFSFERYNGILGKYPTNQRSIEIQLMRKFLRDNQVFHIKSCEGPSYDDLEKIMGKEKEEKGSLFETSIDPERVLFALKYALPSENVPKDWYCDTNIYLLRSPRQTKLFTSIEHDQLKAVYKVLYPQLGDNAEISKAYSRYKSYSFAGENFGSELTKSERSSLVMASWIGYDGNVALQSRPRPGRVQYYFLHNIPDANGDLKSHLFAKVSWFQALEDDVRKLCGDPVELWCRSLYEIDGPASIIPVQRIKCKCIASVYTYKREQLLAITPRERSFNI